MNLFPSLEEKYAKDCVSAPDAQRLAEFIAFGPVVFQVARLMLKFGILEYLRDSQDGVTREAVAAQTGLSYYAVKCLLEASLSIGLVVVKRGTDLFTLSKTGWFLLTDPAVRVNMDFNHDVNYEGWFHLEESFLTGKPEGLKHFGDWPTIYEGLSSLPPRVQESWLKFDHFYSDSSFPDALKIVFDEYHVKALYDVGGNTGKWALRCVGYCEEADVTVLDLPQQITMMEEAVKGHSGAERIHGFGINLLDDSAEFPRREGGVDGIWMSQFLDCFSMDEIVRILRRAKEVMTHQTRLFIMEPLWDRQKYEPAAFCLTMTSLYFTALANGNSKMYNTEDLQTCIERAGLRIEKIHDHLGQGHSIVVVKVNRN